MKITPAKRLEHIEEYVFSQLGKEIKKVEEKTKRKVLNFGQGHPDISPSPRAIKKLYEFITEDDAHLYPGYGAAPVFIEALQTWYKKRFDATIEPAELLPLLGGKDGIAHLPLALFDEGDEILMPNPGYMPYKDPTVLVGAKPITYDLIEAEDFKLNISAIEKKITKKTKALWLNFPSNPTGQIVTLEELKEAVALAKKHNIIILYDNAYSELTFDGYVAPSILQIEGAKDIAVEFSSFSKTFSFAGFRMGWVVGNKDIIALLAKVKTQMDSGLSMPLQKLGAYVLTDFHQEWHDTMLSTYQSRRDSIIKHIKAIGMTFSIPLGSMYIWAKIPPEEKSSEEFCHRMLHEKQIVFTPGTAFGSNGERYVRISIGVNVDKIEDYFS